MTKEEHERLDNSVCIGCGIGPDEQDCCKLLGVVFCASCLDKVGYQIVLAKEVVKETKERLYYC
jgi:hypothetical protein